MREQLKCGLAFETLEFCKHAVLAVRREFSPGFESTYNLHDFPQVWYCYRGHYFHKVDECVYECNEGSVIVLPVGVSQRFWTDTGMELMRLDIRYDLLEHLPLKEYIDSAANLFLPRFFKDLDLPFSPHKTLGAQSRLVWEQVFSWFALMKYAPANSATKEQFLEKLEQMFSVPEYKIPEKCEKRAMRIVQNWICPILRMMIYMNDHFSEKITDERLLQEGNMSRAVMYRVFKRVTNQTYAQYLQNLRVRHVHLCLRETTYSLADIAELCGFYDTYHMSRVYSKCYGETISKQRIRMKRCRKEREN